MLMSLPMRHALFLASSSSLLLALAACSGATSSSTPSGPGSIVVDGTPVSSAQSNLVRIAASSVPASSLSGAVTANNAFAVDLYGQVRATAATSNVLTSPLSASFALTMTYAGAAGTTASQMASTLHYGSNPSAVFAGQNALSQALASRGTAAFAADSHIASENDDSPPSESDYALQVVNSVWGQTGYSWEQPFLDILAEDYGTGVYLEDFETSYDPARVLINDWVASETANKIEDLLPEGALDAQTRMVLVNAVHVKFPWATPFDPSETAPASFTTASATTVSTPFMNQGGTFSYVDDGQAQIIGLPLSNSQVAVIIALPHGDLATYEAGLTATSAGLAMPTAAALVALSLPKVSFTSPTFSLANALETLGMPVAFDKENANFTGLCAKTPDGANLYIGDVLQKAEIAMQETGVEAAAATAVVIEATAGAETSNPPTPIPMNVNRPYLMSIVDVPTGAVLFVGHVADPTAT